MNARKLAQKLRNFARPHGQDATRRNLMTTPAKYEETPSAKESEPAPVPTGAQRMNRHVHKVDAWEKKILVWTNSKYKTEKDIPSYVTPAVMARAKNKMRIGIANCMIIATIFAAYFMVQSGKRAQARGESLQKQTYEWHEQLREEYKRLQQKK